jgi:iron complex outermembrane recepter protein
MEFKRKAIAVFVGQVCAAAFTVVALPVAAQEAQEGQSAERVTITGSSIKRIAQEGALPVQTFSRQDIERSGAQSVVELVQNMSSMQGFQSSSQAVGGSAASISTASIHGIGDARTLVLLNGRRVATWAGQNLTGFGAALDLNTLPISSIDRIEVLTDGASALYGADAVAGVINFILRTNQTTADISVTESIPKGGVGIERSLSLSKGWGDLQTDGQNLLLAFTHDTQHGIRASERDFSRSGIIPFSKGGNNYVLYRGSTFSVPANWIIDDHATGGANYENLGNPYLTANGVCPPQHMLRGGLCRFDFASTLEISPNTQRDNFLATFNKKFGEHTFSTDVIWSQYELTSRIAPAPVSMMVPTGSGLYNRYMPGGTNVLDPNSTYGDDLYAYWRGVDAGARSTKDTTEALHLAFSLKGTLGAWDYTTSYTHSTNKWHEDYLGGWMKLNEQQAAINSGAFDPFLSPGQQSAAGQAAIGGMQYLGMLKSGTATLDVVEVRGSRDAFKIGQQVAQLGAGVDMRRERFKYSPSDIAQGIGNGIAGDTNEERPYNVSRNAWGAFAELMVPITKQLEVTGALRHDHYADFGNTDNFKVSSRYQPAKSLLIRGSIGSGFRAPSVPQVAAGRQLYGVTGGQYSCPVEALAAQQALDPTVRCHIDGSQYEQIASGNQSLKPEKSQQWSIGFQVEPADWATFGADLWNVHIKDRIGQLDETVIMSDPAAYLKNFTVFNDPGTGNRYVALYIPNENLGEEKYSGVDVEGKLLFHTPVGKLRSTLHWTHMLKHDYQRLRYGDWFSDLSQFNDGYVTFRDIVKLIFTLDFGPFENTLGTNWKSGYRDYQCTAADCGNVRSVNANGTVGGIVDMVDHHVDEYYTFDWQTRYKFDKNLSLTGGVLNLTDRKPPFSLQEKGGHQVGYDNRYADPRGRVFYATLNYKF